jgi:hypothetical protein
LRVLVRGPCILKQGRIPQKRELAAQFGATNSFSRQL